MLFDVGAQDALLDGLYGAARGAGAPASFLVALFDGDPQATGAELAADGGYVRVTVANDGMTWPGASGGQTVSVPVTFPTSTGAWSDTATHFVLYDAADGTTAYGSGLLSPEVSVDVAGTDAVPSLTLFYNAV